MNNNAGQLAQWLNACRNQPLHIVKKEQDDVDEVQLNLQEASFTRASRSDPDDYVANQTQQPDYPNRPRFLYDLPPKLRTRPGPIKAWFFSLPFAWNLHTGFYIC